MDFLDPKKERFNNIKLLVGYCLVAIAIAFAALILLYQAFGYGVNRHGTVIQNGLLFVSSQPSNGTVLLNGQTYKSQTDTRVLVPADSYSLEIQKSGYRTWKRQVVVNGNDVQHFDYPFLFPQQLQTSSIASLSSDPSVATESPDKRWLLLGQSEKSGTFTLYDLKHADKPATTDISLPTAAFTAGDSNGAQSWSLVEWAADNRHVLFAHTYTLNGVVTKEYVLVDRDTPVDSIDLTTTLHLTQNETLNLFDNRIDQFYVYDTSAQTLSRVNESDASVVSKLEHVLTFKTYGDNMVLYVTDKAPTGKQSTDEVSAVLQDGQKTITLRTLPANATSYVLNLAEYSGDWYAAVGSSGETGAYIYKNPQDAPVTAGDGYPQPFWRFSLSNPTYLSFSSNTQFLLAESGQEFMVYDLENLEQYHYRASEPIDQPQMHATWMDGDRLLYVSNGKLEVFDYDYRNRQSLVTANAQYLPFFSQSYSYLYTLQTANSDTTTQPTLTSTSLLVK